MIRSEIPEDDEEFMSLVREFWKQHDRWMRDETIRPVALQFGRGEITLEEFRAFLWETFWRRSTNS